MNLHAAYLHALADLEQSVALLISCLLIWWKPSSQIADLICTIIFAVIVSFSTVGVNQGRSGCIAGESATWCGLG